LRYEIAGSQNSIWFDGERPNEIWFGHRNRPNELLFKDPGLMDDSVRPYIGYPGGHNEGYPDSFKMLFKAFYDYIAAGDFSAVPQFPTFEEGHREILLCEAILRSANEQRWVSVEA
jgi:predicted dehydrogenase